jgi:hypothetical protein
MVLFPIDANDSGEWLIGLEQISALVRTVQLKAKKKSKKIKNFKDRRQQCCQYRENGNGRCSLKLDLRRPINQATAHNKACAKFCDIVRVGLDSIRYKKRAGLHNKR